MRSAIYQTNTLSRVVVHSASSLKQQSVDKHVAPLEHIILIPSQPTSLSSFYLMMRAFRRSNKYQFSSLRFGLEPSIYHTRGEHANHCTTHVLQLSGADTGFQIRGGVLKKIAPSGGRRENFWGISCENSRFYAKKADYGISLLPLTSNSKNKTVMSKLHCMSNLQFKFHFNPLSGYLGVAGCRILLLPPPPGLQ